jgi:excisionase family DNA binding protein
MTKKKPLPQKTAVPSFDPNEPLLDIQEAAKRLRVSTHTVRKLTYKKGLRWTKIGREIRFKREWVEDFIESAGR